MKKFIFGVLAAVFLAGSFLSSPAMAQERSARAERQYPRPSRQEVQVLPDGSRIIFTEYRTSGFFRFMSRDIAAFHCPVNERCSLISFVSRQGPGAAAAVSPVAAATMWGYNFKPPAAQYNNTEATVVTNNAESRGNRSNTSSGAGASAYNGGNTSINANHTDVDADNRNYNRGGTQVTGVDVDGPTAIAAPVNIAEGGEGGRGGYSNATNFNPVNVENDSNSGGNALLGGNNVATGGTSTAGASNVANQGIDQSETYQDNDSQVCTLTGPCQFHN